MQSRRSPRSSRAFLVVVAASAQLAVGCSDGPSETQTCTPGTVASCSCPGGESGQKECLPGGAAYSSCDCAGAGGHGGAGGDSGGSGGSGGGDDGTLWSRRWGAASAQQPARVAVDSAGNVVVVGAFENSIDLGAATLDSAGSDDVFVAKLTADGQYVFSASYGGAEDDQALGLAVDGAGNSIVCGFFNGAITLGTESHSSAGAVDAFVVKLDPTGTVLWSRRFGGSSYDYASAVGIDSGGNVLLAGFFQGQVSFDGNTLTASDGLDVFVAKLDPTGTVLWSESFGGAGDDQVYDLAVDGNDGVLIGGRFVSGMVFTEPLTSAGGADVFVAKLDDTGAPIFGKSFGDGADQELFGLAAAPDGGLVLVGYFEGAIDFGGDLLLSGGGNDAYVAKLDATGAHVFSQRFGGPAEQYGGAVAVAETGEVLVTGAFTGTVDFGLGPLQSAGDVDVFLAELSASGSTLASRRFGTKGAEIGISVAVDPLGPALLTGWFDEELVLGDQTHVSAGARDVFVAKLER